MLNLEQQEQNQGYPNDLSRSGSWRTLRIFFIYRATLALTLAFFFFSGAGPSILGRYDPSMFVLVCMVYLGLIIVSAIQMYLHSSDPQRLSYIHVYIDIIALTLMMHASGGITTGMGMLLLISIAAGSAVMRGRTALAFASIAAVCVIGEQIYSSLNHSFPNTSFTHAGILGASFFATAILADVLSRSLRESEKLVSQKELDLANLEQLNEYIVQHMQAGIIVVDNHERMRLINEYAWFLLGMPDAMSGHLLEQASPELSSQLKEWNEHKTKDTKVVHTTPAGKELEATFTQLGRLQQEGTLIYLENTTTVNIRAQQLKLASLGRLTASIAHEIRNPLGAISHAQQLLDESPHLDQADKRLNHIIHTNTERVNEIIESVMSLSRRQQSRPTKLMLGPWIREFAKDFVQTHKLGPDTMTLSIQPESTLIYADQIQLRQLITNLCENSIRHFNTEKGQLKIKINGGVSTDSGGTFMEIVDNGPGIEPDVAKQIFEPFFTTRNDGTGLGLYITKELCETNDLELEYRPTPGGGSCFRIGFPDVPHRG